MMYDVRLVTGAGDSSRQVSESLQPIRRLGPVLAEALGFGLQELDGISAAEASPVLADAIAHMQCRPRFFKALGPHDNWHDDALQFLIRLLADCQAHPRATVRV